MQYESIGKGVIEVPKKITRIGKRSDEFKCHFNDIESGEVDISEMRMRAHEAGNAVTIIPNLTTKERQSWAKNNPGYHICKFCLIKCSEDEAEDIFGYYWKKKQEYRRECKACNDIAYKEGDYNKDLYREMQYNQRVQWHQIVGGWFFTYVYGLTLPKPKILYVGATANPTQRNMQHVRSSNNELLSHNLQQPEDVVPSLFAEKNAVYYQVYGHDTVEQAWQHELELYNKYIDLGYDLTQSKPTGIPPANILNLWKGWTPPKDNNGH